MQNLDISSPSFEANGLIPARYTCDGEDISPEILVKNIPAKAKTLVLIMDDPDAPMGTWDHWLKWNILVTGSEMFFAEGTEPDGVSGKNSWNNLSYGGPCPPDREHRYFFKIYALDTELNLPEGSTKTEVESAMSDHILASGELLGRYNRLSNSRE